MKLHKPLNEIEKQYIKQSPDSDTSCYRITGIFFGFYFLRYFPGMKNPQKLKSQIFLNYSQNAMIPYLPIVFSNEVSTQLSRLYSVINSDELVISFQFNVIWQEQFVKFTLIIKLYSSIYISKNTHSKSNKIIRRDLFFRLHVSVCMCR